MDFSKSSGFVSDQTETLGQKLNFPKSSGMKSGLSSKKKTTARFMSASLVFCTSDKLIIARRWYYLLVTDTV